MSNTQIDERWFAAIIYTDEGRSAVGGVGPNEAAAVQAAGPSSLRMITRINDDTREAVSRGERLLFFMSDALTIREGAVALMA